MSDHHEEIIARRIRKIRDSWDEETAYRRQHGTPNRRPVEMPRYHGYRPGGRAAHCSAVGGGLDQHDLFFDHLLYVMDHESTE